MEFALLLPVLLALLVAGTDITFWFLKKFRLDNAASAVANLVAQSSSLAASAFPSNYCSASAAATNYFAVASQIAAPMTVCGAAGTGGGATIISGLSNNGTTTKIVWQQRTGDAAAYPSMLGATGSAPTLPNGYSVPANHSLIATELYTSTTTWSTFSQSLLGIAGPTTIYAYAVFEPRFKTLATPQ